MNVVYDKLFFDKLKRVDVRIQKSVKGIILLFSKDPNNPQLNNHLLRDEFEGYRSIDITSDWRAIYQEIQTGAEKVAYFIALGTHKQLYKK